MKLPRGAKNYQHKEFHKIIHFSLYNYDILY